MSSHITSSYPILKAITESLIKEHLHLSDTVYFTPVLYSLHSFFWQHPPTEFLLKYPADSVQ